MCKQCPTVGDFVSWIFRCGRCCNTCKEVEHRCKCERCDKYERCDKCERKEKCYECFCQEKKEPVPCYKEEQEHCHNDCNCKFY